MNKMMCVVALSFLSFTAHAQSPTAAEKACANKVIAEMKDKFAEQLSQVDGEEFSVDRVSVREIEVIEFDKKEQQLNVLVQLLAAKTVGTYVGSAKIEGKKCRVIPGSVQEMEIDPEDSFINNESM